jgi:hypothetical protein
MKTITFSLQGIQFWLQPLLKKCDFKVALQARHQWLMPIILATAKAERRITVRSQPRQISL